MGAGREALQRRGARFVATGLALASLALLTVAALPNAANAALLYYKLGAKLGLGGGSSISCPSPGQCTAVAGTQEATFNPAAPKNVHRAAIDSGGASLNAVACPSTTQCTGVDSNGRELTFNPAAPVSPSSAIVDPIGQTGNTINGLACPSTTQCTAVDSRNVATFDPMAPAAASVSAIDPTSISEMNGVACPSTSQCTIVSGDGTQYTINPVAKTGSMSVIDLNRPLWGIACPSISQCTAVDADSAVTFNPGAPGTPARFGIDPSDPSSDQSLTAVVCPSTSQCTAVDNQGLAVQGNPASPHGWGAFDVSGGNGGLNLVGVSCGSVNVCVALDDAGDAWVGAPKGPPPPPPTPAKIAAEIRAALRRAPLDPTRSRPPLTISDILYVPQAFAATIPFDPRGVFRPPVRGQLVVDWYLIPRGAHLARARARPTLIATSHSIRYPTDFAGQIVMTRAGWRLMRHAKRVTLTAKATFTARRIPPVTMTRRFTLRCAALTPKCNDNYHDFCSDPSLPPQKCGGNIPRGAGDIRRRPNGG